MILKNKKGFTLIEILIVVAIIAILASVILVGLGPTQEAGRDARRVSDLAEVQNGLELYYNACGNYPGPTTGCGVAAIVAPGYANMALSLKAVASLGINSVPNDPANTGTHVYKFGTTGGSATHYVLQATLENASGTVFSSYTAPANLSTNDAAGDTGLPCTDTLAAPDYCVSL